MERLTSSRTIHSLGYLQKGQILYFMKTLYRQIIRHEGLLCIPCTMSKKSIIKIKKFRTHNPDPDPVIVLNSDPDLSCC